MSNIKEVEFERKIDPAIITILEEWLERAKRGDLIAIAIAGAKSDGGQVTEFNSGSNRSLVLNSAITSLLYRYNRQLTE